MAPADAGRYEEFRAFLEPYRKLLRAFVEEPPTDLIDIASNGIRSLVRRAMRMRLLGRERMLELLRIPPMCVADWLDEWFENDLLKATLALPAISGGFHGPRSPGTAANLLLQEATAETGSRDGGPSLVSALERAGRAAGVEIRTGEEVAGVCLESGQVRGVDSGIRHALEREQHHHRGGGADPDQPADGLDGAAESRRGPVHDAPFA